MNYIGLDVHTTTTRLSLVRDGEEVLNLEFATREEDLIEAIESIRGAKRVALEEGAMADWVKRVLENRVPGVVICNPRFNRLISEAEDKDDPVDAYRLAWLLWMGQLQEVYHGDLQSQQLKEMTLSYWQANTDLARAKNRVKNQFTRRGIVVKGPSLYGKKDREQWRSKLHEVWAEMQIVDSLFQQLDYFREQKAERTKMLRHWAKTYRTELRILDTIPGVGFVVAITFLALIGNPRRFSNKRQLWSYCSLAVRARSSAGKQRGRTRRSLKGRPHLKNVLGIAAQAALRSQNNELVVYAESLKQRGLSPAAVRRSLSRKIAVLCWTLWKSKQDYQGTLAKEVQ